MRTLVVNALRALGKPTGPGHHVKYLAQQWSRMATPFDRIIFVAPRHPSIENLGGKSEIVIQTTSANVPPLLWEQVVLPYTARNTSLLFCPTYTAPLLSLVPTVVANHGIYESMPGEFSLLERLRATPINRASARRADRVLANSESTKDDLVKFFNVDATKIDIVYPAAHDIFFSARNEGSKTAAHSFLGDEAPYIIFVGKLAKRRNVPNLIEAFSVVRRKHELPHNLVIVGPNTTDLPVAELAEEAGIADALSYIPYLEQDRLAKLYAAADLYVLPTTYEGISQTMFEAMASGTAVLTTKHPTLEEGAGDAAFVVDTPSVPDLVEGLSTLLLNPDRRKQFEQKAIQRAEQFSWRRTAEVTMEILDRVGLPSDR